MKRGENMRTAAPLPPAAIIGGVLLATGRMGSNRHQSAPEVSGRTAMDGGGKAADETTSVVSDAMSVRTMA
jgi:hypothetical protein